MTRSSRGRASVFRTAIALTVAWLCSTLSSPLQSDGTVRVSYQLVLTDAATRNLRVEITYRQLQAPLELHVSRSSPGRYAMHPFAENVFDLHAEDGAGRPLPIAQPGASRWHIAGHDGTVHVRYRVFADRIDGTHAAIDRTHAHLNIPATLAWAEGFELEPLVVAFVLPHGVDWRIATQLLPTGDPLVFTAPNLQYLMDSPVEASALDWRTFTPAVPVGSTQAAPTIALAVHHTGTPADVDALLADFERIVPEAAAVFGEYPEYEGGRYTFLADYVPWAQGDGMEHRNSAVLTSSATITSGRRQLTETAAHEYFHCWNVERIRPRALEPFDLDDVNTTGELWLAEGVTSYYEALILRRAGLMTTDEFGRDVGQTVNAVVTSPAHGVRSAVDMSRLAPFVDGDPPTDRTNLNTTFISYYTYGEALGLGLDLSIREKTGNVRSLDDFMRAMWRHHGRPGGSRPGYVDIPYTAGDVRDRLAETLGDPVLAAQLLARYVDGREVMDYSRLLARAGFVVRPRFQGKATLGPIQVDRSGSRLLVGAPVPSGSAAAEAGLAKDDEIVAIDGKTLTDFGAVDQALSRKKPGDIVTLRVLYRGERTPRDVRVTLRQDPALEIVTVESTGGTITGSQRAFRGAWLESRVRR
jgi:predicted metalloprotease with PDZ domain